ncbi:MAG: RelA/SpoT domain-containing protein [Oscillospiraceae bacterium]|nr:RelA/SpoT domain-containing protein [Oscillospiraceae bacterium]
MEKQLEKALKNRRISIAKIESRAKEVKSAVDKSQKQQKDKVTGKMVRKYKYPKTEIMDFAGVRVVAYLKTDIDRIGSTVIAHFDRDPQNTGDKQELLGEDKVGYNATHFIVSLKESDLQNPNCSKFRELCCEVQVATIFQHSWATVFHDRGYKIEENVELSSTLIRRTNLIAGVLELLDNELLHTVEQYDAHIGRPKGKHYYEGLSDEVNEDTLRLYLTTKLELRGEMLYVDAKRILELLGKWGIGTIGDLDNYFNNPFMEAIAEVERPTIDRVIDCLLIFTDLSK